MCRRNGQPKFHVNCGGLQKCGSCHFQALMKMCFTRMADPTRKSLVGEMLRGNCGLKA